MLIKKMTENDYGVNMEKNLIYFSIIMPTYNRAFCIEKAINSLLNQTYKNFELIIIDDGSTDNTKELIEEKYPNELLDKRIVYKKLDKNQGVCKARNIGLKLARYDWIGYLDSDNEMLPDFLETFKNTISENLDDKIFYSKLYGSDGLIVGKPFDYNSLLKDNFIDIGVFIHHKSLIKRYGNFDTTLKRLVDWDLILRYTKNEKPVFIDKALLKYSSENNYARISNSESYKIARKKISYKQQKFITKIFSIKNEKTRKVITILGIRFKIKSQKLIQKELLETTRHKLENAQKTITTLKNETLCPICGSQNTLVKGGVVKRDKAYCSKCGSFERHRFLYFIYNFLFLNTSKKIKLLHIAPENNLYKLIKKNQLIEYVALDINPEQYPLVKECIQGDVRNMPFDDKSFDVIIHNQVMEHIVEEKQFIDECVRVLKDNGVMIINIPYSPEIKTTFEDINITTEEEREKLYYQKDHVRLYGQDMLQKYDYLDITRLDESIMPEKLINLMNLKREITKDKALLDAYFIIRKVIK